jgi:hypothetical protein
VNFIHRRGILSLLNPEIDKGKYCICCNLHYMRSSGQRCKNCPFIFNSSHGNDATKISPGSKFKLFGVPNATNFGKYHLFYFLYYPELNFTLPSIPPFDLFGNPTTDKTKWAIHHINGQNWDDTIWNLLLVLNTEHPYFESLTKQEKTSFFLANQKFLF